MRTRICSVLALGILLVAPELSQGQAIKSYGVRIGVNSSSTHVEFDSGVSEGFKRRFGLNAGLFVEWFEAAEFSLLTEAAYTQRGFSQERIEVASNSNSIQQVQAKTRLDYFSIPLLAKFRLSGKSAAAFLVAGPRFDILINRSPGMFKFGDDLGGATWADLYDDQTFGGTVGLGAQINRRFFKPISLEIRYNFNFADSFSGIGAIEGKNNSIAVWLGIAL